MMIVKQTMPKKTTVSKFGKFGENTIAQSSIESSTRITFPRSTASTSHNSTESPGLISTDKPGAGDKSNEDTGDRIVVIQETSRNLICKLVTALVLAGTTSIILCLVWGQKSGVKEYFNKNDYLSSFNYDG